MTLPLRTILGTSLVRNCSQCVQRAPNRILAVLTLTIAIAWLTPIATAQTTVKSSLGTDTSLRWIPADAAFYGTTLNAGERWAAFRASNAYNQLSKSFLTQLVISQIKSQWNNSNSEQMEQLRESLEGLGIDYDNVLNVLSKAGSQEVFIAGGSEFVELVRVLDEFNSRMHELQLSEIRNIGVEADAGDVENADDIDAVKTEIAKWAMQELSRLEVPSLLMGFRTSDSQLIEGTKSQFAAAVSELLEQNPEIKVTVSTEDIGDGNYVVVRGDGQLIPWEDIAADQDLDLSEEILETLKKKKMAIAVGSLDDYVLMAVGADTEPLRRLSQSDDLLIDHPRFARLRKDEDKPLTGILYVSQEYLESASRPKQQIDQFSSMGSALLAKADIDDPLRESIDEDIKEFATDLREMIPKPGTMLAYNYAVDGGYRGVTQNWTENLWLDGSKALSLLAYVGEDPIGIAVRRTAAPWTAYKLLAKWGPRAGKYRDLAEESLDEGQQEMYQDLNDILSPMFRDLDQVTRSTLMPALKDGEAAMVWNAPATANQWHMVMPPSEEPLAMPQMARVLPVHDRDQFLAAWTQYGEILREAQNKIRGFAAEYGEDLAEVLEGRAAMIPMLLQGVTVPTPEVREIDGGQLYVVNSLAPLGVDARMAFCMGLTDDTCVFAMSPDTAEALLTKHELAFDGPVSDAMDEPAAAVNMFDFRQMIDVVRPWVTYGMKMAATVQSKPELEAFGTEIDKLLDVVGCLHRVQSVTTLEEDSTVTVSQWSLKDLDD